MAVEYVLVTGATGFIGAHVVDQLLARGFRVRGTARSQEKADRMRESRPKYKDMLDFAMIQDIFELGVFDHAVERIDGIIHVASPLTYDVHDTEQELLIPAINGTRSILQAAHKEPSVKRIVVTSSFASVIDISLGSRPGYTYTGQDWNPITYQESRDTNDPVVSYRGSKKFAELEAWNFIKQNKPSFDLVTLCPPMVFGPVVHPVARRSQLNVSNSLLWSVADGVDPLPESRVPVWVDVRDLANAHVQALLTPDAGGKRYIPCAPDKFSYQLAADYLRDEFDWAKDKVTQGQPGKPIDQSYDLEGAALTRDLGVQYTTFHTTVLDAVSQFHNMPE